MLLLEASRRSGEGAALRQVRNSSGRPRWAKKRVMEK
jgi:hypothetical protein